jgi:hypothetical protein
MLYIINSERDKDGKLKCSKKIWRSSNTQGDAEIWMNRSENGSQKLRGKE